MMNVGVDHVNKLLAMTRQFAAQGAGISSETYGAPYPGSNVTIVSAPTQAPSPSVIAPQSKPSSGLLKSIAAVALMSTGVGAAGVGGYLALDKALATAGGLPSKVSPVATSPAKPQEFQFDFQFDPTKNGLEIKPKP